MDIRLFPSGATDFSGGGITLKPQSAEIVEEANGSYELQMEYLRDDKYGRHKYLRCGAIVYCDVPSKHIPLRHVITEQGFVTRYVAKGKQTSKVVTKRKDITDAEYRNLVDDYMREHEGVDENTAIIEVGKQLSTSSKTYEYSQVNSYKDIACTDKFKLVANGTAINMIEEYDDCIFGIMADGNAAYFKLTEVTRIGTTMGDVWSIVDESSEARTQQPFRIISVAKTDGKRLSVTAQHIYFDAGAVMIAPIEANLPLATVCERLNANGHINFIAGDSSYISTEFDADNPVSIASRICEEYDYQLVRDGFNAYFLPSGTTDVGIKIQTGKDIVSLSVTEDHTELVTRWIAVIDDEEQDPVDSEHINDYPLVYVKRFDAESAADAQMQIEKDKHDGIDLPAISIDVSCKQGVLDGISLFDVANVVDELLDTDVTANCNSVTYDAITKHITSAEFGQAKRRLTANVFTAVGGNWQLKR